MVGIIIVSHGGVDIKELNLGSMAHSQGKVVCTKAVSMGSDDVKTFDELLAMGIKIDVRKVPAYDGKMVRV